MPYDITIGGKPLTVAWNQETAKRYAFRASRVGVNPFAVIGKPAQREFALITILWLILPQEWHLQFATAEDLHVAINHDDDADYSNHAPQGNDGDKDDDGDGDCGGGQRHGLRSGQDHV